MDAGRLKFENYLGKCQEVPGLKFDPTDEQVINQYLQRKIAGILLEVDPIRTYDDRVEDLLSRHPETLRGHYPLLALETSWWFYTKRDPDYPSGSRSKVERASGLWKVSHPSTAIGNSGFRRRLAFKEHSGSSSAENKWFMEEYSIRAFMPFNKDYSWIVAKIYPKPIIPSSSTPLSTVVPASTTPLSTVVPTTPLIVPTSPMGVIPTEFPCSPSSLVSSLPLPTMPPFCSTTSIVTSVFTNSSPPLDYAGGSPDNEAWAWANMSPNRRREITEAEAEAETSGTQAGTSLPK